MLSTITRVGGMLQEGRNLQARTSAYVVKLLTPGGCLYVQAALKICLHREGAGCVPLRSMCIKDEMGMTCALNFSFVAFGG